MPKRQSSSLTKCSPTPPTPQNSAATCAGIFQSASTLRPPAARGLAKLTAISFSHWIRGRKMDNRSDIWRLADAITPRFIALSDKVWGTPEVCYTEARSAAEHLAELRHQGFRITENVADIPTALIGEWGKGGPVIAFLGEYDALPGLSQEADVAEHRPLEVGGHGHGCGPNIFGSGALLARAAAR